MVDGVPAAGKSSVARALADATGWPILALDTVKAPFLAVLPPGDRLFNRTLGRARFADIFELIADAPAGSAFIVDAWFGFRPLEVLAQGLARAGVTDLAEVWRHAPPETVGVRYAARLGRRPAQATLARIMCPNGSPWPAAPRRPDWPHAMTSTPRGRWTCRPWPTGRGAFAAAARPGLGAARPRGGPVPGTDRPRGQTGAADALRCA